MVKRSNPIPFVKYIAIALCLALVVSHASARQSDFDLDSDSPSIVVESQKQGEWITDFEIGLKRSQLRNVPLLVVLGAEWCGWCKKLEEDLDKEEASGIWEDWVIVKIDVDHSPEVASKLEANALPALRVLGIRGDVVGTMEGYVPLAELESWLEEQHEKADPILQQVLYGTSKPTNAQLDELIAFLSHRTPAIRTAAIDRLAKHPHVSLDALTRIMRSGKLAERLSAIEILERLGAPLASYDPWDGEPMGEAQITALLEWARAFSEERRSGEESNSPSIELPADIDKTLSRYLEVDDNAAISMLANLSRFGNALMPNVDQRMSLNGDLPPQATQRLRLLAYMLTASPKLRLSQPGLLAALARSDASSRHQAANTLFSEAEQIDLPLVDYLSRDDDPLIREFAVRKIASLSALNEENVKRLLGDSSLAVRTGVLAGLAENATGSMTTILCEYLQRETNEDLLVYGAKCLGEQNVADESVINTLVSLLLNDSWRVRAATLDAAYNTVKPKGYGSNKQKVSSSLSLAIVKCLEDKDTFVSNRAFRLLPYIVTESNAKDIARLITNAPDQLDTKNQSDIRGSSLFTSPPAELIAVGKEWLKSDSLDEQTRAAHMLAALSPASLEPKLASLLSSNEAAIRLIGYRSILSLLEQHRGKEIASFANQWRASKLGREHIARWSKIQERLPAKSSEPKSERQSRDSSEDTVSAEEPIDQDANAKPSNSLMGILFGDSSGDTSPDSEGQQNGTNERADMDESVDAANSVDDATNTPPPKENDLPDKLAQIDDLFGGTAPATKPKEATVKKEPSSAKSQTQKGGSPSKWLSLWLKQDKEVQPNWWRDCNEIVSQRIVAANDADESRWLEAVHLALGNTDRVDAVLLEINKQISDRAYLIEATKKKLPSAAQLVAWISSEQRVALLKSLPPETWDNASESGAIMAQICHYDNEEIALWLIERESKSSDGNKLNAIRVKRLLNCLLGEEDNPLDNYLFPQTEFSAPSRVMPVNALSAITFLTERYAKESNPRSRAIVLAALSWIDRSAAVAIAKEILMDESSSIELTPIAQQIVFEDLPAHSNVAARELVMSPNLAVMQQALTQLSLPAAGLHADADVPVPAFYSTSWEDEFKFPVLPSDLQSLEVKLLEVERLNDPKLSVRARLLLLSLGHNYEASLLEPLKDILQNKTKLSHVIAAAHIAGLRVDPEALASYEAAMNESDSNELKEFYRALAKIPKNKQTSEFKALRKKVLAKSTGR